MYLSYLVITVLVYMECESMEFNNTNDSVIIDLNDVVGNSDLVAKISSLLDTEEYTNKKLFLKIGNVSLKQSQLLSIKALIEAMNSKLADSNVKSYLKMLNPSQANQATKKQITTKVKQTMQQSFVHVVPYSSWSVVSHQKAQKLKNV